MGYNFHGYSNNVAVRGTNAAGVGLMGSGVIDRHGGPNETGPVPEERAKDGIIAILFRR